MATSKVKYLGDLRTESTHLLSNKVILTDAPLDNYGKGEAFSPTDLVANSLASCMLTVMAIKARTFNVELLGATADVTKIMGIEPRRISQIDIVLNMGVKIDDKTKIILERVAHTCPVLESLHPDMVKNIKINWL